MSKVASACGTQRRSTQARFCCEMPKTSAGIGAIMPL
jgi:hypothetical protein